MNQSRIHLLPENVVSQIAAAEVVQRPAAVVKELVENAIDAGSTHIKLVIQEGGKQLIQVIDNGEGMSEADARRCFERHATSKISSVEDLFNIQTLGFRGEALSSIATVAQVELITKTSDDTLGTKVIIEGGKIKKQSPTATPKGTQITVKNIFFNTPARRNFLKSTAAENRHIIEEFQRAALMHPHITFTYWQNGAQMYNLRPAKLIQRIVHLFGDNYQKHLIPCKEDAGEITLDGYIGAPSQSKRTRGGQFLFVNGRYIKSALIHHAIKKAFEGLILPDTFPFYILSLTVPPQSIDIHVHPMKTEVKFDDDSLIYTIVTAAIKKALAVHHAIPSIDFGTNVNENPLSFTSAPIAQPPKPTAEERAYTQFSHTLHHTPPQAIPPREHTPSSTEGFLTIDSNANFRQQTDTQSHQSFDSTQEKKFLNLHNTYILAPVKSGILVVNLKAAYQRILYERYCTNLSHKPDSVQKLLFPSHVTLTPADFSLVQDCQESIEKLGFRLEMCPPDRVTFTAQPPEAQGKELQELIEELIEQYKSSQTLSQTKKEERWAKSLAKRIASYKRKKMLNPNEMQSLVDQLFACKNANYTPDGKKTWCTLPLNSFSQLLSDQENSPF